MDEESTLWTEARVPKRFSANEPGYRRVRVAPRPGAGVSWARMHHDSPNGRIGVEWSLENGVGTITCDVPTGTECELELPNGNVYALSAGTHIHTW